MKNPIIEINSVSKKYRIGKIQPYISLRDTIMNLFKNPFDTVNKSKKFWALKNISLTINKGDVIGIIGHNGAGKTTLLKILSRITPPTSGNVIMRGRIASLLEVGTGFHPELTGRENIFLNGAILGMSRREITKKFDDIVKFAEIENFLDTPVKKYSSGMYMRLAFAVAANLESEILVIDEILSVGDAEFQKKCFAKMEEASGKGRTILFVSHNMPAITRLCERAILLERGSLIKEGKAEEVVSYYLKNKSGSTAVKVWEEGYAPVDSDGEVRLISVSILDEKNQIIESFDIKKPVKIIIKYEVIKNDISLVPIVKLTNSEGVNVFVTYETDKKWNFQNRKIGIYQSKVTIPGNLLSEDNYYVSVDLGSYKPWKKRIAENDVVSFLVVDPLDGPSARGNFVGHILGVVRPYLNWNTKFLSSNSS